MRTLYLLGFGYVATSLALLVGGDAPDAHGIPAHQTPAVEVPGGVAGWFRSTKPYCNAVEVETRMRRYPPPDTREGRAFQAACYALAGRTDRAREVILTLSPDERWRAAGVVFNVGHPVADAGDDRSASSIMELVVEFWPNHYMALYHAGAARFSLGEHEEATRYLRRFLDEYRLEDGWTVAARDMLEDLGRR